MEVTKTRTDDDERWRERNERNEDEDGTRWKRLDRMLERLAGDKDSSRAFLLRRPPHKPHLPITEFRVNA